MTLLLLLFVGLVIGQSGGSRQRERERLAAHRASGRRGRCSRSRRELAPAHRGSRHALGIGPSSASERGR